jgi:hypothetical protein
MWSRHGRNPAAREISVPRLVGIGEAECARLLDGKAVIALRSIPAVQDAGAFLGASRNSARFWSASAPAALFRVTLAQPQDDSNLLSTLQPLTKRDRAPALQDAIATTMPPELPSGFGAAIPLSGRILSCHCTPIRERVVEWRQQRVSPDDVCRDWKRCGLDVTKGEVGARGMRPSQNSWLFQTATSGPAGPPYRSPAKQHHTTNKTRDRWGVFIKNWTWSHRQGL